jgi:hypothetical protein
MDRTRAALLSGVALATLAVLPMPTQARSAAPRGSRYLVVGVQVSPGLYTLDLSVPTGGSIMLGTPKAGAAGTIPGPDSGVVMVPPPDPANTTAPPSGEGGGSVTVTPPPRGASAP